VGRYDELANLATFLISDGSAYINGESVTIDGGEFIKGAGEFNWMGALTPAQWDALSERSKKAGK
jgi:NAD(P)-dependent dehydrogenase (short-subunit alcohol dehydrogenase family)